ncbi:hypothetical protein STRIP9103_08931, partial [Streptomyces ipomoeae 91-03]
DQPPPTRTRNTSSLPELEGAAELKGRGIWGRGGGGETPVGWSVRGERIVQDRRQFARSREHRPVTGVHLDQPPPVTLQRLGHGGQELVPVQQALDVRGRKLARRALQDGGLGECGTRMGRRPGDDAVDLLIGEPLLRVVGRAHARPDPTVLGDRLPYGAARPARQERLPVDRDVRVDEDHMRQPVADPLGGLAHGDARVTVPDQDDVPQIEALHLVHDVPHMGLLPGGHPLLLGEPGQCERMDAMAELPQLHGHFVPRPRTQPGTRHQHEMSHDRTVARGSDNRPAGGTSAVLRGEHRAGSIRRVGGVPRVFLVRPLRPYPLHMLQ